MEADHPLPEPTAHVPNVGRMVEEMEAKIRNLLQEVHPSSPRMTTILMCNRVQVYFGKTRDIVSDLRSVEDLEHARRQQALQRELVGFIKRP